MNIRRLKHPLWWAIVLSICVHLFLMSDTWQWGQIPAPVVSEKVKPLSAKLEKFQAAKDASLSTQNKPAETGSFQAKVGELIPKAHLKNKQKIPKAASEPIADIMPSPEKLEASQSVAEKSSAKIERSTKIDASALANAWKQNESEPFAVVISPVIGSENRSFPKQVLILYGAYYGEAQLGTAKLNWQQQGQRYHLDLNIKAIFAPELHYISEGEIGENGRLKPQTYRAYRNTTPREKADFNWDQSQLSYGDNNTQQVELKKGAQDVLSLTIDLAMQGGQPASGKDAKTQVTTGKKVYEYPLKPEGESLYATDNGDIRVVLVQAKGAHDENEYWLAPAFANLPIRLVRQDQDKRIELRAYQIDINGKVVWKLPPRKLKSNEH